MFKSWQIAVLRVNRYLSFETILCQIFRIEKFFFTKYSRILADHCLACTHVSRIRFYVELIKMRKVKKWCPNLFLFHMNQPATALHSRYQSTLWSTTVPQLCSCRPQARASQANVPIWLDRIFVGSSRIINKNLLILSSYTTTLFTESETHFPC